MLFSPVYIASDPRRSPTSSLGLTPAPYPPAPKSFRLISFTDPHPLSFLESYRFKNMAGGEYSGLACDPYPKFFRRNTYRIPRKCCKQRAYGLSESQLSLVDATLTRNTGVGDPHLDVGTSQRLNVRKVQTCSRSFASVTRCISRASQCQTGCWPPFVTSGYRRARNETGQPCFARARPPFRSKEFQVFPQLAKGVECPLPLRAFVE
jgi:hypothetical protein